MKFKINNFKVATKLLLFSTNFYAITSMASPMNQYSNELQSVLSGSITDEAGNPLAGATIHVKGTPKSTASDQNGIFKLNNVKKNEVISIHMIGFTTQEVRYNSETTLNIKMISVAQSLEEAVVVGYGTIDKKELTSAVSTIKQKDMVAGTVSPLLAIQGKVPGLSVISTNGTDPNAGISLQLRGVNSVNASQGPLVVIDGVPGGDINSVAKEDIESINVLRDASAAAIYGTRASGGVILITTKRPQIGKAQVNFTSEYFIETVRKKPEVLSAEKFIEYGLGNDLGHKTDWYDEVTNNNPFSHRQVVNISGGSENANVYTTFTKRDATGMAITSKREEIGGRINSSFKFFDGFAELNTNVSYNEAKAFGSNNDIFNMAMVLNPTETPYDVNDVSGFNVLVGGYDYWNPVAEVKLRSDLKQFKYLLANSTLKLNLTEHLTTSATIGVKNNSEHGTYYRSAQHRLSRQDGVDGNASQYYNKYNDRVFEWTVNYNNRWADHAVNAVAGYSYQDFNGQGFSANNSDFPVDGIKENDMGTGSYLVEGRAGMGSWRNPWVKLAAFFGRVNYSYLDRYILTATARYEGSSKFAPKNRWGFFPGLSAGWRISQEPFLRDASFINDLKLRAGYGETGNEGFDAKVASRMYSADTWFLQDGNWFRTYGVMHNQNPDIKWEVKKEYNLGLDFSILENKLSGRIDFYKRKIDDLIYDISVSQPPAIHDKTTMNVGSMQNTGYEFELNYKAVSNEHFTYSTGIVASHNKSTLNTLWGSQTFTDRKDFPAPGSPGSAVRLYPGEDIGRFYIWKFAGFTDDGYWQLYDKDGNIFDVRERSKTVGDKAFVGNAIPTLQLSWNNQFSYKNWDASIYMRSWIGHDVFNMINMYYSLPNVKGQNVLAEAYDKHKNIKGEKELSDYWLEKGTFLKVDALNIGYSFNNNVIKPIKSLRIYATARDLFVFTNYTGLDPEVNINGLEPGFEERNVYPKTRTFMMGLQINF
ncbi:SusC/RagA family TonB-linked outer membrane protein [Sphingobacterium faecium]|jgi:TonB-linked SusC/RagA family outer membrane protein|uniref:SusC/RagA family TonB-linked outer membrane protein n=1 Tax=Sphingobacterium faecium TaxID=34087 RepID=UPI00097F1F7E|nr:SusC/RagA family TonB-linked outer membrane protein [Sphingobacterium faecium]WGQ14182.1 SusC/RagA family TonB-linked outer membrane protein [Sphingobacterium faecium]SJN51768.1 SusC, outer membrane protein involved in starch binding [Sphingobacterium faecium PCAi_F2.5]